MGRCDRLQHEKHQNSELVCKAQLGFTVAEVKEMRNN